MISVKPVTLLLQRFLSKLFTIFSVNDVEQICGSKFQHSISLLSPETLQLPSGELREIGQLTHPESS